MSVRLYLRSPLALAWTLLAVVLVGAVVLGGWLLAAALTPAAAAGSELLGGLLSLGIGVVAVALAAVLWVPAGAAIAYIVGHRARGRSVSAGATNAALRRHRVDIYRWCKTRVAVVDRLAERLLDEADVSRTEVAAGCGPYVVPALLLDAPRLPAAVERANRVVPNPGRQRLLYRGTAATFAAAAVVAIPGVVVRGGVDEFVGGAVLAVAVVGAVVTAALDAAWRASTYAQAATEDGFVG
ncbi:uncharacterized protein NP_0742A [Natronomonas pharaonis DSM 2160]|uniref:Uncharacterized protein n=1 Tax=Natronomonas pharaonis (strain ATCC 35678 / DSM 2160 / CIP 103997 / JCM 8858 / NBRC 14720 / NCIMB 2260 / Gabara) TaxID=348780 RepID=A0A1U7EU37_NATPD|nr:hypothetical protein [Natronomonas pharaonis]CAI48462.1 uncharacterized protein NP_0742A [Natronomonas pharaonis DSM 2160]